MLRRDIPVRRTFFSELGMSAPTSGGRIMDPRKFAVIGGDLRNVKLAEAIHSDGNNVSLFGFKMPASVPVCRKQTAGGSDR